MNEQDKRIAAIRCEDDGLIAAVWMAHDTISDTVEIYDSCEFRREVLAVIAAGLNARGRWIPIAWEKSSSDLADKLLLDHGCKMLVDPVIETPQETEMLSREIWERMRTGRFKVDRRLADWQREFKLLDANKGQIPVAGYPFMAATRYAVAKLRDAKRLKSSKAHKTMTRQIAMV